VDKEQTESVMPSPHGRSPFRYPGGKAFLAGFLAEAIAKRGSGITRYAEPYAGGAGAAIELLARGTVQHIILNDFDPRIYAVWHAILHQNDRFQEAIEATPVTMETWYRFRDVVVNSSTQKTDPFELGFATYFLNRTNRSGIIQGAGPIGGYSQSGKWLISVRYSKDTMLKRVEWLGQQHSRIEIHNLDGIAFLRKFKKKSADDTFFFIDPPYVSAGSRLYLNAMSDLKHKDLASFLIKNNSIKHWLVTYDDCDLIRRSYIDAVISELPVRYSLQKKRLENEVCIVPAS
jgi:DNA adenine methylase